MPPERISIAGYADTAPVDSNDTEEGRQRNRRVDMVVLNETGVKGEPERMPVEVRSQNSEAGMGADSNKK
jgi:hypothetical protein